MKPELDVLLNSVGTAPWCSGTPGNNMMPCAVCAWLALTVRHSPAPDNLIVPLYCAGVSSPQVPCAGLGTTT